MREPNQIITFVLGMAVTLILFALLVVLGPGIVPSQLDKCWTELQKAQPNCSSRQSNGAVFMKDLRCVRAEKGIQFTANDDSGWYKVSKLPEPERPTVKGKSRARPQIPDPNE